MITINNSNKPPKWMMYVILILLVLLICALYRGCRQYDGSGRVDSVDTKGRLKRLINDSIENSKQLADNSIQRELLEGQLEVSDNKNTAYLDSFGVLNAIINNLKKRHKPVTASIDTNVTTVPNDYIEDCSGCFAALGQAQQLGLRYKSELDNKDNLTRSKIKVLDNRIGILEKQNAQLGKSYRSLLDSSKNAPVLRRTLFATIGAMSINQIMPNAIGGGFLYEDKRRRIFGLKYYVSEYGSVYQGEISFPLSLKKR